MAVTSSGRDVHSATTVTPITSVGMPAMVARDTEEPSSISAPTAIKAALITRGMAEISRLGMAMGCKEQTFGGLAGIGDLIVTATSMHSRNNRCGMLIGQGVPVDDAIKQVGMVVEGINALPAAMELAKRYGVEMPIVDAVYKILYEGCYPVRIFGNLCRLLQ